MEACIAKTISENTFRRFAVSFWRKDMFKQWTLFPVIIYISSYNKCCRLHPTPKTYFIFPFIDDKDIDLIFYNNLQHIYHFYSCLRLLLIITDLENLDIISYLHIDWISYDIPIIRNQSFKWLIYVLLLL